MSFNDYWVLILPFFGAIVGIIFAQFLSLRKNIGLKLILSFSGAFLLELLFSNYYPISFQMGTSSCLFSLWVEFYFKLY